MKVNFFFFLFTTFPLFCFGQNIQWKVDTNKSSITYKGNHVLHSWEGINNKVYGLGVPDSELESLDKLAILIYVRDFDSNNSGRDAHALEILDAIKFPEIKFYSDKIKITNSKAYLYGSFDFHGIKINKELKADLKSKETTLELNGNFNIKPSDFKIKLPSFLSIKIDDLLKINYTIVLNK